MRKKISFLLGIILITVSVYILPLNVLAQSQQPPVFDGSDDYFFYDGPVSGPTTLPRTSIEGTGTIIYIISALLVLLGVVLYKFEFLNQRLYKYIENPLKQIQSKVFPSAQLSYFEEKIEKEKTSH